MEAGWLWAELQQAGLVTADKLAEAQNAGTGDTCLDLLAVGAIVEDDLLRFLGIRFQTRYVTTEKLGQAAVAPAVLAMIPADVCTELQIFPVRYDPAHAALSIVAAAPSDPAITQRVREASGAQAVVIYVALPFAIDAAIRKWYGGDIHAFARVERLVGQSYTRMIELYDQRALVMDTTDEETIELAYGVEDSVPQLGPSETTLLQPGPAAQPALTPQPEPRTSALGAQVPAATPEAALPGPAAMPDAATIPAATAEAAPPSAAAAPENLAQTPAVQPTPPATEGPGTAAPVALARIAVGKDAADREALTQTIGVLVGLIEMDQGWRRGHAADVAELAYGLARRCGIGPRKAWELRLAALVHELGKPITPHLTALTIDTSEHARTVAQQVCTHPALLFERTNLPRGVPAILNAMYERPDGRGVPGTLSGASLPIQPRLLAVADCYCDLMLGLAGAGERSQRVEKALAQLTAAGERRVLDSEIVDVLASIVRRDTEQPAPDRSWHVLLVEHSAPSAGLIETGLKVEGYAVTVVTSTSQAARELLTSAVDAVVAEADLDPTSGIDLLQRVRQDRRTASLPFIITAERVSSEDRLRALQLGATDYLVKPYTTADLLGSLKGALTVAQPPVPIGEGSLDDLPLARLLVLLGAQRKTGMVQLQLGDGSEGRVFVDHGQVVDAAYGDVTGENALGSLLRTPSGSYTFDAGAPVTRHTVTRPLYELLREAAVPLEGALPPQT